MRPNIYSGERLISLPQIKSLGEAYIECLKKIKNILPIKVSDYVINELIDWSNPYEDPIFLSIFPRPEMLDSLNMHDGNDIYTSLKGMNPNPSGQEQYIATLQNGYVLNGVQRKYKNTLLFFPKNGQTCHSHCVFCFRFSQFTKPIEGVHKFSQNDIGSVVLYLKENPEVTDIIFTGGDPLTIPEDTMEGYIDLLLDSNIENLSSIRFATRALTFFPQIFHDHGSPNKLIKLFKRIIARGIRVNIMAHLGHPVELSTTSFIKAINILHETGVVIRSQSPILKGINDSPEIWRKKWEMEVKYGIVPYYMFITRDAGMKSYFDVPIYKALEIFSESSSMVGGLAKTVRGPIMSCSTGKIEILGQTSLNSQKMFVLRYVNSVNPGLIGAPFFAKYSKTASWVSSLVPINGFEEYFRGAG
jgi:KamA family protein